MPAGGSVAEGFEAVRDTFEEVLETDGGSACAFAAYRDGRPVVDLWGGSGAERDTSYVIFSGTKGLVAVCLLILAERGDLDLASPAARYWPEFGASGKARIRVADIVSHQAGLPGIAARVSAGDLLDDVGMARLLARQERDPDVRAVACYHPYTFGWLCGELVQRIDGRSVGTFFAEEVATPLGLDLWIGLPSHVESRVSTLSLAPGWGTNVRFDEAAAAGDPLLRRIYWNPQLFSRAEFPWNERAFQRGEIPAANAIGTASSIARLYGCLAAGGSLDGVRIMEPSTVELGARCLSRRRDPVTRDPMAVGVGFWLQTELAPYGPVQPAFGHGGSGGSMHGAWPGRRTGFSFCPTLLRDDEGPDARSSRLLTALARASRSPAQAG